MKEISNSELAVLNILWESSPISSNEVVKKLADSNEWHEKTVKTLLNRLVKKQAIGFQKKGRGYLYSPLINQSEYQIKESQSFVERMFSGRIAPLVAGFAKENKLSAEDVAELKTLIDNWQEEDSKKDSLNKGELSSDCQTTDTKTKEPNHD
ncbi:BlaI/MecI/CopY family transcriptional regulator [Shewanella psychropiezotolerans]|uniref:BlaI/MecI/CopY family transcriptional regulator n=1 Tax=Shewanella psychropiezotolerans TaxID=2593655 RepID=A0ABX5X299_9GAMM|nr:MULTISPECIES: BlaI/MecI/CopY family transcriptional regulator [Shewanella]MPY23385.1 BlaI/MecI/CopY family transcriptional regulator [Shewanella sp. YLB-07]QDO85470.1 BlaI/MecI/CopY family transcriptional regulator [Shewanella psychropiezotolerans]